MIKKLVSILMISMISFVACKKEDVIDPVKHFGNGFLTHFQKIRMFTRNGEVMNDSVVQQFANDYKLYFFKSSDSLTYDCYQKYDMVNDDSLDNVSSRCGSHLKRTSIDIYDKFSEGLNLSVRNDTNDFAYHIVKYKGLKTTTSSTGVQSSIFEYSAIAKKKEDTLFIPIMKYITLTRYPWGLIFSSSYMNNVFSIDGINKLRSDDTLVLQSFDWGLRRIR
jgi:hypothetical protein